MTAPVLTKEMAQVLARSLEVQAPVCFEGSRDDRLGVYPSSVAFPRSMLIRALGAIAAGETVCVPVEPTPEIVLAMNSAYWGLADRAKKTDDCVLVDEYAVTLYRAMLQAAQK